MIIQLKNFGPIEHFEFDTDKDMHFIFGENNIGKSYAISAVYLILKNWKKNFNGDKFTEEDYINEHESIQIKLEVLKPEIDITEELKSLSERLIKRYFINNLKTSFQNTFSSISELSNRNTNQPFEIHIKTEFASIIIIQEDKYLRLYKINFEKDWVVQHDNEEEGTYHLPIPNRIVDYIQWGEALYASKSRYYSMIVSILSDTNFISSIYFLPASRSGIYNGLSSLSSIVVQITQLRNQIPDLKFEIPNLTEPNADYFLTISNINSKAYNTPYSKFAKILEDNFIKGKINFDKSEKKLYYEPASLDLSLELSQASSMISEISFIIAYLKFVFDEESGKYGENFLFIEEPEAHLHPKIQVELIKLFAEMAKKGLKIVMTSHSNYMFNKLSNMILAKEIDLNTISVAHMKMGEKGSYVDKESMLVDEFGIEDNNFADVAEELYMERLKLSEQNY